MKKTILVVLAIFNLSILVAQNNPPATNPPTGNTQTQDRRTQPSTTQPSTTQPSTTQPSRTQQSTTTTTQSSTILNPGTVQVPGDINKRFSTDYPNVRSTWSQSGTNYRSEYMDNTSRTGRAIIYDQSGTPVGTESELGSTDYPKTIGDYYSTTYPNEKYKVWSSEDTNGKRSYYVTRKTDILWFDDKGNYTTKTVRSSDVMNNNK